MKELATELLREKFVIHDPGANPADGKGPTIALSNRMMIALKNDKGITKETLIIRAQNMHSCVRMAARIVSSFSGGGSLLNRASPYDWESAWDTVSGEYEQSFNPQRWVAIYSQGKIVFEKGQHHALLDVIESCTLQTKGQYESAVPLAESVIRKSGKVVKIEYDGNVALVVDAKKNQGRFGIILRSPNKTTTFNFSVTSKMDDILSFPQCLGAAAGFLEGIQLAFMVGMNNEKIKRGIIERHTQEEKQTHEAGRRLSRLGAEIANLETTFEVRYRPEKPEFFRIVSESELLAQKIFSPTGRKS